MCCCECVNGTNKIALEVMLWTESLDRSFTILSILNLFEHFPTPQMNANEMVISLPVHRIACHIFGHIVWMSKFLFCRILYATMFSHYEFYYIQVCPGISHFSFTQQWCSMFVRIWLSFGVFLAFLSLSGCLSVNSRSLSNYDGTE